MAESTAQTRLRAAGDETLDDHNPDTAARNTSRTFKDAPAQQFKRAGYPNRRPSAQYVRALNGASAAGRVSRNMVLRNPDREWIEQRARAAGFDLAGIAAVPDAGTAASSHSISRFAAWIASGRAGEMDWLKRTDNSGELVRGDLRRSLPWAGSVVVCAINYNPEAPRSIDSAPSDAGWVARYAWSGRAHDTYPGSDYHDVLLEKLRAVEQRLHERFGPDLQTRCYVDTGPIIERDYAQRAGIGWIGKNTCVLNQGLGSWLLLGVIITSLELASEAWALTAPDRCGTCTRCIEACPTNALTAPRQMDASLCISYLTIEKKGAIDEPLRPMIGRNVFGCDICQDVCPWNRRAPIAASNSLPPRPELVNPSLDWLAAMDGRTFNLTFRGSPLERTGRKRLQRNVAIAMGNSGDARYIPKLREWTEGDDPVLAEAAQWALDKLNE